MHRALCLVGRLAGLILGCKSCNKARVKLIAQFKSIHMAQFIIDIFYIKVLGMTITTLSHLLPVMTIKTYLLI